MAQDHFQIALEHHRAGRLQQAEAGYRGLIAENSDHADALHWLGVLLAQAKQFTDAMPLLERAATARPKDLAFQHNLAQAQLGAGRFDDAISTFERVLKLDRNRVATLVALAHAHLMRRGEKDAKAAVGLLRRAHAAGLDSIELHYDLGVAYLADRQTDEAMASLRLTLMKDANHAWAYHHLAMAHRLKNEVKDVRKNLNKALELNRELSASWYALGLLEREAGNEPAANASFLKAAAAKSRERGGAVSSIESLEKKITPDESMRQLHDVLADATNLIVPPRVPPEQVARLFDEYAANFDEHLIGKLGYRVPQLIAEAIRDTTPFAQTFAMLDLGCGTGLCGELLRWKVSKLHGVDLSPAMIERARARNVYDQLEVADLVDALKRNPRGYDLLTAADVLNYLGDLSPVMESAAAALRPSGFFAFSVEAGDGDRFERNRATHRYAHAESYVRKLAKIFGFNILRLDAIELRKEANQPVKGWLAIFQQSGSV